MKSIIRQLYKWKYGVRGCLRPPLGPQPGKAATIFYHWKLQMWRMENAIYHWTGLPERWHRWMQSRPNYIIYR